MLSQSSLLTLPLKVQEHQGRGSSKKEKLEGGEEYHGRLLPRYNRAFAIMNTHPHWILAQAWVLRQ